MTTPCPDAAGPAVTRRSSVPGPVTASAGLTQAALPASIAPAARSRIRTTGHHPIGLRGARPPCAPYPVRLHSERDRVAAKQQL